MSDEPAGDPHDSGMCNLRDVGGIPLVGGGAVASGVLYRGDAPMAGDEPPRLSPWPPATVIDLRAPAERDLMSPAGPWPDGIRVVELSLLAELNPFDLIGRGDTMSSSEVLTELFAHVLKSCRREVATAVELIATSPAPILVHCSGGKDRTALIVVLVLDALGADTGALLADHLLSNERVPALEKRLGRAMGRPLDAPLSRVDEASIRSAMETWRAHPDGAQGWLLESGLSREHLDALRGRLVARDA